MLWEPVPWDTPTRTYTSPSPSLPYWMLSHFKSDFDSSIYDRSSSVDTQAVLPAVCSAMRYFTLCHLRVLWSHTVWFQIPALWLPDCATAILFTAQVCCSLITFSWPYLKRCFLSCGVRSGVLGCVAIRCSRAVSLWKLPWLVTEMCADFPGAALCSLCPSPLPQSPHDFLRLSFISALWHVQAARWNV